MEARKCRTSSQQILISLHQSKISSGNEYSLYLLLCREDIRVDAIIQKHQVNIYQPSWIIDSIKKNELMEPAPKYMLFIVPWLRDQINSRFDMYGDPFYKDITREELKEIIGNVKVDRTGISLDDELRETREELREQLHIGEGHAFK